MLKRYRSVRLGPTRTVVEHDSEGRYLLRAATALRPHPLRLTQRLVLWAERAPERAFLARRGDDGGWRGSCAMARRSSAYVDLLPRCVRGGSAPSARS